MCSWVCALRYVLLGMCSWVCALGYVLSGMCAAILRGGPFFLVCAHISKIQREVKPRSESLRAIMPRNFYIMVHGGLSVSSAMHRAWSWFQGMSLKEFRRDYRFYYGDRQMELKRTLKHYEFSGGEEVEGDGVDMDHEFEIYLDQQGIVGGAPKPARKSIGKAGAAKEEDDMPRGKGVPPPERALWLKAKVRDVLEKPDDGTFSAEAQKMLVLAKGIYGQTNFYKQFVANIQDTDMAQRLSDNWQDRSSKNATTFARSLVEQFITDYRGVSKAYELLADSFEAAYIAEFYDPQQETFDNGPYKKILDEKVKQLTARDMQQAAQFRAQQQMGGDIP